MMNWSHTSARADAAAAPIHVNVASRQALLADLAQAFQNGQGVTVATINLDHVVKLRRQSAFRDAYTHHSHITADGNPIVWLSRLTGHEVALLPGSELIEPAIAQAADMGVPIAFFGSDQGALDKTAQVLQARYPSLRIAACIAPPMGFDPESAAARSFAQELSASGAKLCFLALGAPKQEIFAIKAHEIAPHMSFMSIGAGLDFIAGTQNRAPGWVRALALEWVWRMALSPRRLTARYMACIAIMPRLLYLAWKTRSLTRKEA